MSQVTNIKRKPLSYGAKLRKLYAQEFYLAEHCIKAAVELGTERDLISYIDAYGHWL